MPEMTAKEFELRKLITMSIHFVSTTVRSPMDLHGEKNSIIGPMASELFRTALTDEEIRKIVLGAD